MRPNVTPHFLFSPPPQAGEGLGVGVNSELNLLKRMSSLVLNMSQNL
jgi:hypothetical protein